MTRFARPRVRPVIRWLGAGAAAVLTGLAWGHAAPKVDERTPTALARALRAEVEGDVSGRAAELEAALQAAPDDPRVRGAAGFLRKDKQWVGYEALVERARKDKRLTEYRQRRKESEPTVDSQLALADWCRSQRLQQQERAHLTAVLSLDPNHAQARQRLGFVRVGPQWLSAEELETNRDTARQVSNAWRKAAGDLTQLARQLEQGKASEEQAIRQLEAYRSAEYIPAIETLLSQSSAAAARCVVRLLDQSSAPEASLSLVRHALASNWPEVRALAVQALQHRDRHSVVPAVIAAFESPWASQAELYWATDGRLLCRYSQFSEGADKRQLAVHDHVLMPIGFVPDAASRGVAQVAAGVAASGRVHAANNQRIDARNSALAGLLREITQEQLGNDAADWWRWWNNENECYVDGSKPLEQVYAITSSYVVGVPPVTQGTIQPGRTTRQECLAGGTVVWTETGPVAVDRIKVGDLVLAQNPRTGELGLKPVLRTTVRAPEQLLKIQIGDQIIRATGGHPFWVAGKGWTLARQLQPGDLLHGLAGSSSVTAVDEEAQPVRTFNLVVADYHSYFCGDGKTLSHDNSIREPVHGPLPGLSD